MSNVYDFENAERGTFEWCVNSLEIDDDKVFSIIGKVVCVEWAIWPEQLVGRLRAGDAVSLPSNPPVAVEQSLAPSRLGHVVMSRRVAWYLAHQFTHRPAEEIGEAFGGHAPKTVKPYLASTLLLEKQYPASRRPIPALMGELGLLVSMEL